MVRNRRSWREAAIIGHLDRGYWRAEFPGGGSGMFKEADIRASDAERDAKPAKQPGRARATDPKKAPRSRYRIDPEAIAAGRLPETAPVVTSATNPHYQKYFDRLSSAGRRASAGAAGWARPATRPWRHANRRRPLELDR
jgi:hypothetical protein